MKITPSGDTLGKQAVVAFVNSAASLIDMIFPLNLARAFFQFGCPLIIGQIGFIQIDNIRGR